MKYSILILVFLFFNFLYGQTGTLKGTVVDNAGDTLPYTNVIVYVGDSLITGTQSDFSGKYEIRQLVPGTYNIKFSFVGLSPQTANGVVIARDKITYLDAVLHGPVELNEIVIMEEPVLHSSYSKVTVDAVHISRDYVSSAPGVHTKKSRKSRSEGSTSSTTASYEWSTSKLSRSDSDGEKDKTKNVNGSLLTAGEISDFSKWDYWKKLLESDFKDYMNSTFTDHGKRFTVQIQNKEQNPVPFATVSLFSKNKLIFQTISDNTGKAELFAGFSEKDVEQMKIEISYNNKSVRIEAPTEFKSGINHCMLDVECNDKKHGLEIAMVVDATGSMDDEIAFLKQDMIDILQKSRKNIDGELKIASVFYRDQGDEYLTRKSDFTSNLNDATHFIQQQSAGGGGDFPEAVPEGLEAALNLDWSKDENTKIIFLVLDAPPHNDLKSFESIRKSMVDAAAKGIRIVPIICSGADKQLEYLMRTAAIVTNGTYTFLTDHSGIGNTHMKPSTDEYEVYTLNQLMVNIINRFTLMPKCEQIQDSIPLTEDHLSYLTRDEDKDEKKDSVKTKKAIDLTVAPNPFDEHTMLMASSVVTGKIYVYDMNGKILQTNDIKNERSYELDMSVYSRGTYYLILEHQDQRIVKKIIKN